MNNSKLAIENMLEESVIDTSPVLRQRQTELVKIIEALDEIAHSKPWQTLNELVFGGQVEKIEKSLQVEARKNELNAPEIYRLNGELKWAKRYNDLYKLAEAYKTELENITKKLNENAYNRTPRE